MFGSMGDSLSAYIPTNAQNGSLPQYGLRSRDFNSSLPPPVSAASSPSSPGGAPGATPQPAGSEAVGRRRLAQQSLQKLWPELSEQLPVPTGAWRDAADEQYEQYVYGQYGENEGPVISAYDGPPEPGVDIAALTSESLSWKHNDDDHHDCLDRT